MSPYSHVLLFSLPVIYENARPPLNDLALIFAMEKYGFNFLQNKVIGHHRFVSLFIALYVKNLKRYSHEQEWRVIIPDQRPEETPNLYATRECPCSFIRLGANIAPENRDQLESLAQKLDIPVYSYEHQAPQ